MLCKICLVSGRVQGVFYRATCQRRARELGVHGHARNLPDGRVEVFVCGEPARVETFIAWLWEGSSASRVEAVEVSEAAHPPGELPQGFHTA